ncbi:MAG: hypothetical protein FJ381_12690 [Verrucomicrobia bacterium]|nr:hypothetical protein [Verrucomicrobiota bacterium]
MNAAPAPGPGPLPYTDTKPQGSADFYLAINATFRFLLRRFGREGWIRYLADLGRDYYAPVNARWREGGLPAVAAYWRAFWAAEPGGEVEVVAAADRVELHVKVCPLIRHLRAQGRSPVAEFCQHCYHLGQARAAAAGLALRLQGGDGACVHLYAPAAAGLPPQDLRAIRENAP